jgi:hypothetical protein
MEEFNTNRCWHTEKNVYCEISRICIFINLKKIAAILLLFVMLFNLIGYRWLFSALENKATAKLEQKISVGDYNEKQLVEIKIPLNMPYYSDKEYENVYGETDWNGNHYRYVKRKVSGNTLYLLCLPNEIKNSIEKAKDEYTKAVNDVPSNKQGSQQKNLIKLLTAEFRINNAAVYENDLSTISLSYFIKNSEIKNLFSPLTDAQPPEA